MILLWGLSDDTPLAWVYRRLQQEGCVVAFVDQRMVLDTTIELSVGAKVEGMLRLCDHVIDLHEVSAAYLRPYATEELSLMHHAGADNAAWQHAERVAELLTTWAELTPALVINRPSAMAANMSKPYQLAWIQTFGFAVPATLITTDPDAAHAFWQQHQSVIYKSVSAVRSIVSRLTEAHLERLEQVIWCPTQFQQYIPGTEYRVHVVDSQIFATQIISTADDYRYAARQGGTTSMRSAELPEAVAERCQRMVTAMGLAVAGIDMRCTPDGVWYCLEVNPSPGFIYFQDHTQQPIDTAVARLLMAGGE